MTTRTVFSLVLLALICGAYLYINDFFRSSPIQITPSIRPGAVSRLNPETYPVTFMLDGKYRLTSIKVVAVSDARTNRYARPIWHMISDTESIPTKVITYGIPVRNMKPSVPKARPEPLQPDVPYRLIVEAGKFKGQVDFRTVRAATRPTGPS